jgi:Na+-translocating ferredoxin:NAD+ oxidoreductase RnfE subunit
MGVGFTFALLCLGGVREILGAGASSACALFGDAFEPWVVMILPERRLLHPGGWLLFFNFSTSAGRSDGRRRTGGGGVNEEPLCPCSSTPAW